MTASTASSRERSCGRGRRLEIDVQVAQPIPGPLDALLDVCLGGEQAAGDLGRTEPAERSEREGDARFLRHGLMADDEEEAERFVADLVGEMRFGRCRFPLGILRQVRQCSGVGLLAPQGVDREVASGAIQPAGRVFGNAAPRPRFQSLHERGLHDVLDQVEPADAERPGQHGDEPAGLVAEKMLHQAQRFVHA